MQFLRLFYSHQQTLETLTVTTQQKIEEVEIEGSNISQNFFLHFSILSFRNHTLTEEDRKQTTQINSIWSDIKFADLISINSRESKSIL